jgi:hypothetical protein
VTERPATSVIVTPVAAGVGAAVGAVVVGATVGGASVGAAVGAAVISAVVGAWVVGGTRVPQALRISASISANTDALRRINIVAPCTTQKTDLQC